MDGSSRPSNASYTVENNDGAVATVAMDQSKSPDDLDSEGAFWEELVEVNVYESSGGFIKVTLSNDADSNWVIADAVRVEKIGDLELVPEIEVKLDGANLTDNIAVDLGSTIEDTPVIHTFTIKNTGLSELTSLAIDTSGVPTGLVVSALGETTLARNETTTFTVTVTAADVATLNTTLQLVSNDGDENPFDIPLTAVVTAAPQYVIIDDGDVGYTSTAGFNDWKNAGYKGDLQYVNTSDKIGEATASWLFSGLGLGKYQVLSLIHI